MKSARAFSLVELLVVIGIFTLISGVILANHSKFNSSVLLGNVGYDIALSVRQAQVYGLSTRQYGSQFNLGYGIHFENSTGYSFFADTNSNKRYDAGTDSIIQTYTLGQGHFVRRFCGVDSEGTGECSDGVAAVSHLDIVFLRPDPDATITTDEPTLYSSGVVAVESRSGEQRFVTIQSTGQISVTAVDPLAGQTGGAGDTGGGGSGDGGAGDGGAGGGGGGDGSNNQN